MKHSNQPNNTAFVLGNGTSRLQLNHKNLLDKGTVYACNAMYREFEPHYLIAVDVKMVNEIIASGYHKRCSVWTNPNKGVSTKHHVNFFNPHKGWSSGPTALSLACDHGHREIYIFGFDYAGINGRFNNVYANTFNYKKSTDPATFHGNWLTQTERTIRDHKNINFVRVIQGDAFIPDQLGPHHRNLKHMNYEDFEKIYPGCIYKTENLQKSTI